MGVETQRRYPAVRPLCLLLPSAGRECRSQREKKILCWSTAETEKGREELSPWLSVARQVFVLWTDSPQLTNKYTGITSVVSERGRTAHKSVGFCNN